MKLTCYHEAGHVISSILNLIQVNRVSVVFGSNSSGETNIKYIFAPSLKLGNTFNCMVITSRLCMLAAGHVAEKIFYKNTYGEDIPSCHTYGARYDEITASALIRKWDLAPPGIERKKIKELIKNKVTASLSEHWIDLSAIANMLYLKKEISHNDIRNCLLGIPNKKQFWLSRLNGIEELLLKSENGK